MRARPSPPPRDPEFDRPAHPAGPKPPPEDAGFYQRLVVNPFLAVVMLVATLAAAEALRRGDGLDLAPSAAIVGAIGAILALQYHCLDCGATGSYHRWRRHACPRVVERWMTPLSAASHFFPMPTTQVVLWLIALAILGLGFLARRSS